ncbi:VCBS repeat-containing protein [Pelagicoccus sp. NFK12]|uniref:VCBS repeat-containing protein n=1 Tax=Pelagicoccus enzymogenes TaxID=2773457 RepID=A0A927IGK1_9BACT|nr:VCBS repeat-containing protein [Pelagicoccus enzymogenes]MBD5778889.1 VCBS repeat-containing protein [Pelagicoccus enzymogenes]
MSAPLEDGYEGALFEKIEPRRSGLTAVNRYSHPEAWGKYWHQYYNGSIGTGVVLGDVNGDGLPDVYLVSKDSPNALYLNLGDFRFEDATESAGVAGKEGFASGASFVDIDNDGDLDLYVCYIGFENELYLNDGAGVFVEQGARWGLNLSTGSNAPSFADMDRDGDLDLYLQCNFLQKASKPEGMPDLLLENMGDRFEDVTERSGISGRGQGHAAIWWDYNEDGWPDVYVANDFAPTDRLYRNNKDNTFTDVIQDALVSAPYFGMGADLGDINNDGHLDFLVADMATPDHVKHHVSVGTQGSYLLSVSKSKISQFMYNMLSLKIGPEQFAEVGHLTGLEATGWTWAVRLVDMDNDGWLDAFFTNGMVREFHNSDLAARMGQARSVMHRIKGYENSPPLKERNMAFRNSGKLSFEETSGQWGLDEWGVSFAASFADFDTDGDLDLILNNLDGPPTLYRNRSVSGERVTIRLEGVESNRFGYGAKLTAKAGDQLQSRELSALRGYMSQDEPHLHFSFLEASAIDELRIDWPSGKTQVLRDMELGRHYHIREMDTKEESRLADESTLFEMVDLDLDEESLSEEEFYDAFAQQPLLPFDETWSGPQLRVGDIDGDGWEDVTLGGATGQETRVFRNRGNGRLSLVESDVFYDDYDAEDTGLLLFDYEGDGDLDILALAGSMELDEGSEFYRDRIYLNSGDLEFVRMPQESFSTPALASTASCLIDVDGDGRKDLLIGGGTLKDRYPFSSDNQVWLRSEQGYRPDTDSGFAKQFVLSGRTSDLLAVDIDGDGDEDLLQVREWGSPILWIMEEGRLLRSEGAIEEAALQGVWTSVAAGDFDGDGRLDFVLGNLGANSKFNPRQDAPDVMFSRIQGGSGAQLLSYTWEGKLVPRETRNIASKLFSEEIMSASRSFEEYARSPVESLFPDLDAAFRKDEMTQSRSMVFYQGLDGRFTAKPLPGMAQVGKVTDIVAADIDGDGVDDVILTQEPLPPLPWAGRRLKGNLCLLLGKAEREFTSVLPWRSGLQVDGYPKHLAFADLDKDGLRELLVAMNEGPLLVFEMNENAAPALRATASHE